MSTQSLGYYAYSSYGLYPYSSELAIKATGVEAYLKGKLTRAAGIECMHARYNTGLFRILWEIASDGITANNFIASSQASVDKSVTNLKSDITEQYWQATGCTSEYFQFDAGSGHTILMDTMALVDHNLTGSAVVTVYGYGNSGNSAPGSWVAVPAFATLETPTDPLERNLIYIAQALPTTAFRHWRITISDPTNPDGFIRIGRYVGGAAMIFTTENCLDNVDFKKENYKDEFKINGYNPSRTTAL